MDRLPAFADGEQQAASATNASPPIRSITRKGINAGDVFIWIEVSLRFVHAHRVKPEPTGANRSSRRLPQVLSGVIAVIVPRRTRWRHPRKRGEGRTSISRLESGSRNQRIG